MWGLETIQQINTLASVRDDPREIYRLAGIRVLGNIHVQQPQQPTCYSFEAWERFDPTTGEHVIRTAYGPVGEEFTYLDMISFDLARTKAAQEDIKIPAWLCTSEEAKARHRESGVAWLNATMRPPVLFNLTNQSRIETFVGKLSSMQARMVKWKTMELALKAEREAGNVQAFFV